MIISMLALGIIGTSFLSNLLGLPNSTRKIMYCFLGLSIGLVYF